MMLRQVIGSLLIGAASWAASARTADAQVFGGVASGYQVTSYYGAPGIYGTTWGVPSLGWPRTYSSFSSPYGPGYAGGYYPYGGWPGYYGGYGVWRPGFVAPGYAYGASYALPPMSRGFYGPGIGAYAPGFGTYIGW